MMFTDYSQQPPDNWSSSASLVFSDRSVVLINSLRLRGLITILKTSVLVNCMKCRDPIYPNYQTDSIYDTPTHPTSLSSVLYS